MIKTDKNKIAVERGNHKSRGTQTRESEFLKEKLKRSGTENSEYDGINDIICITQFGSQNEIQNKHFDTKSDSNFLNNIKDKKISKPLIRHEQRCLKFSGIEEKCLSPYKPSVETRTKYIRNKFSSCLPYQKQNSADSFKANRDKSFLILIGIVLIFLICNIPRLFVKVFIISSGGVGRDHFENCLKNNRLPVPGWIMLMGRYYILYYIIGFSL